MPNPPPAPPAPQQLGGPVQAVPCPHCGKKMDCRMLQEQQLLDAGNTIICDFCGRVVQVLKIVPVTWLTVRQSPAHAGVVVQPQHGAGPQPTTALQQRRRR